MSQTIDSPLKLISDSINGRDKLLKLAEANSSGGGGGGGDKVKKKGSKLFFGSTKSGGDGKEAKYDLAFTSNIEHLANRENLRSSTPIKHFVESNNSFASLHDVNSNVSCDHVACECFTRSNSTSLNDSLEQKIGYLNIGSSEAKSFTSANEFHRSRIPHSINRRRRNFTKELSHSGLNRWPDTEDLSVQTKKHGLGINNYHHEMLYSKSNGDSVSNNDAHLDSTTMHHVGEKQQNFLRSRYQPHHQQLSPLQQQQQQFAQKMTKSQSHNILIRNSCSEAVAKRNSIYDLAPIQAPFFLHKSDSENDFASLEAVVNGDQITFTDRSNDIVYRRDSETNIKRSINRFDPFVAFDEDNFINSPKKIVNQILEDYALRRAAMIVPTPQLISTPNQHIYEKHFLRESQKNALSTINSHSLNSELEKQKQSIQKKSNSFDSFCESDDPFHMQALSKPKSETDLVNSKTNDLAGIMHLEEAEGTPEENMFNRFRKSFSLRFSKHWPATNGQTNKDTFDTLKKECEHKAGCDTKLNSTNSTIEEEESSANDINQNRIYRNRQENDSFLAFSRMSTIDRRKSRADIVGRKSFRRNSTRKINRLKRSHSQPSDKSGNQISPQSERSLDSDFDVNSPAETTKSNSELNDSPVNNDDILVAEAIWYYLSNDNEELSFNVGDLIEVSDTSHKEWWWGSIKTTNGENQYGWFPASYVRLKVSQEETLEEALANTSEDPESTPKKRMSMSKLSSEQVRANVVLEIINTERDFVKNLKDVIEGYLKPCRDRSDMFDDTRISTIFGNIEDLYIFQTNFLQQLEQAVNWEQLSSSVIGHCFLDNEKGFRVYCEFCKNHPLATSELQDLYTDHKYIVFFEGCRLLQNMIDISLDGFLLTPIQKICKYPLQLGELLKYTRTDHADYDPVKNAYGCMQRVAQLVNERKRRFESLEQLIILQESFENWEGPPLLDSCSLLIHSGEVSRITSSSWSKEITLMLFDRLLVLCKKDTGLLKKSTYIFKSRIDLDHVDSVIALEDNNKDVHFGAITKNAFKLFYKLKQKWYLFQAKSVKDKEQWTRSFEQQRERVREDEEQGFVVSEQDKKGARIAHQNHQKPRKPRVRTRAPYAIAKKPDTVIAEIPLGPLNGFEIDRNRAGSLPSYIYQEKQSLNNLYKHRQSTIHKKSRSNWFQLGSNKKKSRFKRNRT